MADRITRDDMLMDIARIISERGTCSRLNVGAVISRDGRIIATGYNGAPKGLPHCKHEVYEKTTLLTNDTGCQQAEHAERNAIAFAARHGVALDGSEMHCTHAPCLQCARSIINTGIMKLSYAVPYRLTQGVELLQQAGVEVVQAQ